MRPPSGPVPTPRTRLSAALLLAVLTMAAAMGPAPAGAGAGAPAPEGRWPLAGAGVDGTPEVVSAFDPPDDPWGAGHRGVDLLGSPGARVRSALPGRVSWAGRLAGRGVVVVDHGTTRTTYEPVEATVEVGQPVGAGSPVGRLETLGSHCAPRACLHWGWLRGDVYLDPLLLVGGGPVRLLPLWREAPVAARAGAVAGRLAPGRLPLVTPWSQWRPWVTLAGAPAGRPAAGGPW